MGQGNPAESSQQPYRVKICKEGGEALDKKPTKNPRVLVFRAKSARWPSPTGWGNGSEYHHVPRRGS
jgi:hypothetical protein